MFFYVVVVVGTFILKSIRFAFLLPLVFMQVACTKFDKEEALPSYIRLTNIDLTTPADKSQGTSSSNITDAWVYINDNLQGVYPLPTKFPILKSGKVDISIRSGIIQNGIDATRIDYPFLNSWDTTITLKEMEILSLKPRINGYKSGTVFHLIEDFEGIGLGFEKTVSSPNDINKTSNSAFVFEGNNSGRFEIPSGTIDVMIATSKLYNLPKQGAKVFLELNYNINQAVEVGILAQNGANVTQSSVIGLRSTINEAGLGVWKKVYVDLSEAVSNQPYATGYKIYFYAKQAEGVSNPVFLVDNIKLVSF